jgi:glycosyltransferase involved in cell wall biosynthesis
MDGVSVIIPCYNGEKYLAPCLESVFQQDYAGPLEILVGDDGSRDRSMAIARSFGAAVRVLRHPHGANHGVSAARNLCIRAASHTYVALLDADDVWLPNHLSALTTALAREPDAGMAYDNGSYMTADGQHLHEGFTYPAPSTPEMMLANCCVFPSGVVIRRHVFGRVGLFDEGLRSCEDYDMWLRVFESFPVIHVALDGYLYRRHAEQASRSMELRYQSAVCAVKKAQFRYPYQRSMIRNRLAVFAFRRGQFDLHNKRYLRGLYHLGQAAFYDPGRAVGEFIARLWGRETAKTSVSR